MTCMSCGGSVTGVKASWELASQAPGELDFGVNELGGPRQTFGARVTKIASAVIDPLRQDMRHDPARYQLSKTDIMLACNRAKG